VVRFLVIQASLALEYAPLGRQAGGKATAALGQERGDYASVIGGITALFFDNYGCE